MTKVKVTSVNRLPAGRFELTGEIIWPDNKKDAFKYVTYLAPPYTTDTVKSMAKTLARDNFPRKAANLEDTNVKDKIENHEIDIQDDEW